MLDVTRLIFKRKRWRWIWFFNPHTHHGPRPRVLEISILIDGVQRQKMATVEELYSAAEKLSAAPKDEARFLPAALKMQV